MSDSKRSPYSDKRMAQHFAESSAKHQFDQPGRDLAAWLNVSKGQRFLDFGSGSGVIVSAAAEAQDDSGFNVAVDASIEMLRNQIKRKSIHCVAASGQELPFKDQTFDRVAAGFVITHLPNYTKGLRECMRILRSGGVMAATAWEGKSIQVSEIWKSTYARFVDPSFVEKEFNQVIPWDEYFSLRANLVQAFEQAGFRKIHEDTKKYLISMDFGQYVDTKVGSVEGTILRKYLGDAAWDQFTAELIDNLKLAFRDRIQFNRNVHFVSGTKP